MNTILTTLAFGLLAAAGAVCVIAFMRAGGIRELIALAKENE